MDYVSNLTSRYSALSPLWEQIRSFISLMKECYKNGGKILLTGNGGSASDCDHAASELLKGFMQQRMPAKEELAALAACLGEDAARLQRGIPAIPLSQLSGVSSAFANDVDPSLVFAQLVYALGKGEDILVAFSTSGNSENIVKAVKCAKALGIKTVALTGESGGKLRALADVLINVPASETYKVQEYHLPIYHAVCQALEAELFGG